MFVSGAGKTSGILEACQMLFGSEVDVSREFLAILHPDGVKAAFRRRARETHPDLHPADPYIQQHQARLFQEVAVAYRQVSGYCQRYSGNLSQAANLRKPAPTKFHNSKSTASSPRMKDQPGKFFRGEVPRRRMIIGRYLYYRGIIPFHLLLESLTWQRRQRPTIGQIAQNWGWIDDSGVMQILSSAKRMGRFGERARNMGLLNEYQVKLLLRSQQIRQRRLGEFFVSGGYLTQRQFDKVLTEMLHHNTSLIAV